MEMLTELDYGGFNDENFTGEQRKIVRDFTEEKSQEGSCLVTITCVALGAMDFLQVLCTTSTHHKVCYLHTIPHFMNARVCTCRSTT